MCTDKKGVCKTCVENQKEFILPEHHNLNKLHDLTDEYKAYFEDIEKNCGLRWISAIYNNESVEIGYLEGPNGELDEIVQHLIKDGQVTYENCLKSKLFPPIPKKFVHMLLVRIQVI
jgi:hypothetical protein